MQDMGSNPIPSMLVMGLYILFIKKEKQTKIVKVMVQSCGNIANDVILGLEKRLNSYIKEHHLIRVHFLKNVFLKSPKCIPLNQIR
jgi:hypothetical protein